MMKINLVFMNLPQGWILTTFDTILNYEQPTAYIVKSTEYNDTYKTAVLTVGKSFIIGYTNEKDGIYSDNLPVIIFDDFTTAIQYVTFPFKVKSSAMKILQPINEQINKKYIFYYMQTIKHNVTTHKRYWISDYSKLNIPIPPLPEQRCIVAKIDSLFSELENGTTLLKTIKAQLSVYRQAVLKWAFEGKLTEEWRHKNFNENQENTIRDMTVVRDMEVGKEKYRNIDQEFPTYELPKEWKWVSIGYISKGVSYGTSSKSSKKGKVVVLRMGNIQNGTFVYDDLAYTSNKKEIEKYQLHEGDVLFNRTNSPELVGKTAIYNGYIPSIFAGYLIRLNQISYINASYLTYYLNSPHARECGNIAKTDGVNQSNINGTKLSTYPFPLCSKSEQQAIVSAIESRLSVCDKLEQTIDQTLALSASLRQSILKKAFEGRLVPQDPNDEPAEKLLERIRLEKASKGRLKRKATGRGVKKKPLFREMD
jgi:type I restriction enzyme, S subunit